MWDAAHTVIRPAGGALIAVATLGDASPTVAGLAALLGGTLAAGTHFTKAGTRAVANTSPEPFSNWILSISEDLFVVGLGMLALKYPAAAAVVVVVGVVLYWCLRAGSSCRQAAVAAAPRSIRTAIAFQNPRAGAHRMVTRRPLECGGLRCLPRRADSHRREGPRAAARARIQADPSRDRPRAGPFRGPS